MEANPFLGLLLIAFGSLSAASFYVPFGKVKNMAWEVYWLIGGFFSWIAVPIIATLITVPGSVRIVWKYACQSFVMAFYFRSTLRFWWSDFRTCQCVIWVFPWDMQ